MPRAEDYSVDKVRKGFVQLVTVTPFFSWYLDMSLDNCAFAAKGKTDTIDKIINILLMAILFYNYTFYSIAIIRL